MAHGFRERSVQPFQVDVVKAQAAKASGNQLYQEGKYEQAVDCYCDALDYSAEDDHKNRAVFYNNRAACYMMLVCPGPKHRALTRNIAQKNYDVVVEDCTSAIEHNDTYVKALRRRAKAYELLDKPTEALEGPQLLEQMF